MFVRKHGQEHFYSDPYRMKEFFGYDSLGSFGVGIDFIKHNYF